MHLQEGHIGSLKDELAARKDKAIGRIAPKRDILIGKKEKTSMLCEEK